MINQETDAPTTTSNSKSGSDGSNPNSEPSSNPPSPATDTKRLDSGVLILNTCAVNGK